MKQSENKAHGKKQVGQSIGPAMKKTAKVVGTIWDWIFKLRKLILAIPVVVAMIMLAALQVSIMVLIILERS